MKERAGPVVCSGSRRPMQPLYLLGNDVMVIGHAWQSPSEQEQVTRTT